MYQAWRMGRKQSAVAAANELPVCPDGNEKLSGNAISCVASVGSAKYGRSRPMMFLRPCSPKRLAHMIAIMTLPP